MGLKQYFSLIKQYDWWIFGLVLLLITFGLVIIYSIGTNAEIPDLSRFNKQLIFFGIGFIAMILFSLVDYRMLSSYAYVFYIVGFIILVLLLIFGTTIRGTTGWFVLGGISIQPVEFVKLLFVIFMARFFSDKALQMDQWKNIGLSAVFTGSMVGLVMLQPDLGSALIFIAIWLGLLLMQKVKWYKLVIIFLILIMIATSGWLFFLEDYQKQRIMTFIDPALDPLGTGYNVTQSIIAVGSGRLLGRGLGLGPQSQLEFLPESEADFIFAVIAEELGFLGAGFVLLLFCFLFYRIWRIIRGTTDDFAVMLGSGIFIIFLTQTLINIGMNLGLMPVTGLPLPFISAGGSSLIVSLSLIGILQSIRIRENLT
ncbi:rod shape-determining protein RodA [Patescibacteria group bacterium]|nr:rod shape-determining protein RodA [Patescibacteria group bacterium]MBU1672894.1 rod shape-determining protein RodA [Patescibacteria group bacterium]MBU1963145.1 rod shape-determining protein RodA [Patescibacteria group bacterium]